MLMISVPMEKGKPMDDVIYRQDAVDAVTTECSWTVYDEHGQLTPNGEEMLGALKNIPPVDAVEVVRCRDCKWHMDKFCNNFNVIGFDNDDFCSMGERKTDV